MARGDDLEKPLKSKLYDHRTPPIISGRHYSVRWTKHLATTKGSETEKQRFIVSWPQLFNDVEDQTSDHVIFRGDLQISKSFVVPKKFSVLRGVAIKWRRRSRGLNSGIRIAVTGRGVEMASKLEEPVADKKKKNSSFVTGDAVIPKWVQKTVTLPPHTRGCHLVTPLIVKEIEAELAPFKCGLAHLFLQHTSASLTINENYDSDVLEDVETWLNGVVPEGRRAIWKHTTEGPDDMPAHIKSSVFGCTLSLPITNGRLNLGTWQGIWLCEHRDHGTARKVVITMTGA